MAEHLYLLSFRGALKTRTRNLDVSYLWIPDRSEDGPSGMTVLVAVMGFAALNPSCD